jgi:Tol biopolymer transport system component
MTTQTKEPRTVERFDRFRDRKQRNRRIGAILVAGALVVAGLVVVSANMVGDDEGAIPAEPGVTGLEGRLVFEVFSGGSTSQLYTIDAAGGPAASLGVPVDPGAHWSPDGTRILVTSTAGPAETATPIRPATVASDGSDFQLLDGVEDRSLNLNCSAFSPNGNRLACQGYSDVTSGLYTVRASDGGDLRAVGEVEGVPTDYSPDGDEILFLGEDPDSGSSTDDAGTLFVVGTDGSNLRAVTAPNSVLAFSYAAWSPDGQWIVFVGADGSLGNVRPDGTEQHTIQLDPEAVGILVATGGATYSPDGEWIAFSARKAGQDNPDLYAVGPDGVEVMQITDTADVAEFQPDWTT